MKSYIGIDWSKKHHDVHIQNERGATLSEFQVPHSQAGFQELVSRIQRKSDGADSCLIGIETAHNSVVDHLIGQGYTVYVLPPNRVESARGTYRASQARNDSFDARVITELLRDKLALFTRWQPDSALLQQIRLLLSWLTDLTQSRQQQHNRLLALLESHYPQLPAAFSKLDGQVILALLQRYPTPAALKQLSRSAFVDLCHEHRYHRHERIAACYNSLQQPQPRTPLSLTPALSLTLTELAAQLQLLKQQKQAVEAQLTQLFDQHEDAFIFRSLPGAGTLLAPSLLAILGEDRQRWPTPKALAAVAGTVPITAQSGNWRAVRFRRACNRQYRRTFQLLARCSRRQAEWAADYFQAALSRGLTRSHADRLLANRWVHIIWTLWQRREAYDDARHTGNIRQHRRPLS